MASFSEKTTAWLQFFRIGGVTSALSGGLYGFLISGQFKENPFGVIPVLVVSFSIYLFGMGLNDIVDVKKDRELRGGRPLPSGRLQISQAWLATGFVLLVGVVCMCLFLSRAQVACFSMAYFFVATYNLMAKHSKIFGPLTVAVARSLNVLGGMTYLGFSDTSLIWVLIHFFHTIGIFVIAEGEDRERALGMKEAVAVLAAPVVLLWLQPLGAVLWTGCLFWIARPYFGGANRAGAAKLVGGLVGAFTLMESCVLLGSGFYLSGILFIPIYAIGRKLQRSFPAG